LSEYPETHEISMKLLPMLGRHMKKDSKCTYKQTPHKPNFNSKISNKKKEALKSKTKENILAKYGGEEHLEAPPKELLLAQTEAYVEYSADGEIVKGVERAVARSKYEEDVLIHNHTAVWGSYWENGEWGFACCKQMVKNSFCTGAQGRALREEMIRETLSRVPPNEPEEIISLVDAAKQHKKQREKELKEKEEREKREKEERFQKALKAEEELLHTTVEKDDRKRGYNSRTKDDYNVTEEDLEAYRLKRLRSEDPMKDFLDK